MTLDEVIAELEKDIPSIPSSEWSKHTQATAIATALLKRLKALRSVITVPFTAPLPGEDPP